MRRAILAGIFFVVMLFAASAAAGADLWLHVTVDERLDSSRPERVTVNIPFSVIERVMPLIPERAMREARIDIGRGDFDADDFRALVHEVGRANENDIVTVRDHDETVQAWRSGDIFILRIEDHRGRDESTEIRVPMSLVDALATGERLELRSLVEALARRGAGEILVAHEEDSQVRVWIDDNPDASRGR